MADLDTIFDVFEGHNPIADLVIRCRNFPRRENMFENLYHTAAKRGGEIFKDEVGVGLGNCAAGGGWEVVTEEDVVEGEGGCGAVGEVREG